MISSTTLQVNKKIFTIPNILSMVRICLIPIIIYVYMFTELNWIAGILIILSGLTDIIDGYIARHFNQVTTLGKILDPIADKLTLLAVLSCVSIKIPIIVILFLSELIKDLVVAASSFMRVKFNGNKVHSAAWFGKVCTFLVYIVSILHIFYCKIDFCLSSLIIIIISIIILFLGFSYAIYNLTKI